MKPYSFSCHSIKALKLVPNQRPLRTLSFSCALKTWLGGEGCIFQISSDTFQAEIALGFVASPIVFIIMPHCFPPRCVKWERSFNT